ncbi:C2H2-like zinc finger protein [Rhynchospora pubera]|uniref:C2H2-like zinc finger protein n=1 Tax=Rhynchospora pubera TaxID=906938 RepID=A0AAV8EL67_9POAL|nr:C2H2-like zinc finger protein [Rhynchospora pubera]
MLSLSDGIEVPSSNLMYNISVLREKIDQLESLAGVIISQDHLRQEPVAVTVSKAQLVAKEIINSASSAADALHQINLVSICPQQKNYCAGSNLFTTDVHSNDGMVSNLFNPDIQCTGNTSYSPRFIPNYDGAHEVMAVNNTIQTRANASQGYCQIADIASTSNNVNNNIVELDAAALVSKCTFYCPICGKGFKRDANQRMHMRAHGDEYKTNEALTKPSDSAKELPGLCLQYSCPVEGCRRNKLHPKFAPLKSVVCVKNHYKRVHCPKMYVCNICNNKEFSILADLKTHEKNCGLRWRCSCGTYFSRKDKLMGHVALFSGHHPM